MQVGTVIVCDEHAAQLRHLNETRHERGAVPYFELTAEISMTPAEIFGRNVRRVRFHKHLTQAQLRDLLEPIVGRRWSRQMIHLVERGRTPPHPRKLHPFAEALGVQPEELMEPPPGVNRVRLRNGLVSVDSWRKARDGDDGEDDTDG